jgi:3-deoxy-D-manno-octulosonate 8-phosphate phosphatase (KDO 8-P phosphatase)
MFKMLVLDIDGVLTDGTKTYDKTGTAILKLFCDRDFTAIKRFQTFIPVCLLSRDSNINEAIAQNKKIDFWLSINDSKDYLIEKIAQKHNILLDDIAYVGDDYYDIMVLTKIGYPFCTQTAPRCVQKIATVIPKNGGDGVVAWLYDQFVNEDIKPNDM